MIYFDTVFLKIIKELFFIYISLSSFSNNNSLNCFNIFIKSIEILIQFPFYLIFAYYQLT